MRKKIETLEDATNKCILINEKSGFLKGVEWQKEKQDDFASGFAEWRLTTHIKYIDQYTMKEVLEIYKKEKGL
jgi:hypothetical protein